MPLILDGTQGETFPSWTTATRPASPAVGQMGYNTTTGLFDQYTASGWTSIITSPGTVIQTVSVTYATEVTNSTTTFADTGLSASITPKFSTSKILVIVQQNGVRKGSTNQSSSVFLQLVRGSTTLSNINTDIGYTYSPTIWTGACGFTYLDSPATTSSTTYKTQFKNADNNNAVNVQADSSTSTMTLMEIAQ